MLTKHKVAIQAGGMPCA